MPKRKPAKQNRIRITNALTFATTDELINEIVNRSTTAVVSAEIAGKAVGHLYGNNHAITGIIEALRISNRLRIIRDLSDAEKAQKGHRR